MDSPVTQAHTVARDVPLEIQSFPRGQWLQPRALDAEYEWLGYESGHPRNLVTSNWPASGLLQAS